MGDIYRAAAGTVSYPPSHPTGPSKSVGQKKHKTTWLESVSINAAYVSAVLQRQPNLKYCFVTSNRKAKFTPKMDVVIEFEYFYSRSKRRYR